MNKAHFVEYSHAIGILVTTMMVIQGTLGIVSLTLLSLKLFSKPLLISMLIIAAMLFCSSSVYKWKSGSTIQKELKQPFDETWRQQEITQKTKLVRGYQRSVMIWVAGILIMVILLLVKIPIPKEVLYVCIVQLSLILLIDCLGLQATLNYMKKL